MEFIIKPYTIAELATQYNVSLRIMRKWLHIIRPAIGKRQGRYYTALQVMQIITFLGVPGYYEEQEVTE